jgi:acyl carrier protein
MDETSLRAEIKALIVSALHLEGKAPADLADHAPLFGEGGLGLDSLDALELAMAIEERFAVRLPEGDEARPVFRSVASLAAFVAAAGGAGAESHAP